MTVVAMIVCNVCFVVDYDVDPDTFEAEHDCVPVAGVTIVVPSPRGATRGPVSLELLS